MTSINFSFQLFGGVSVINVSCVFDIQRTVHRDIL